MNGYTKLMVQEPSSARAMSVSGEFSLVEREGWLSTRSLTSGVCCLCKPLRRCGLMAKDTRSSWGEVSGGLGISFGLSTVGASVCKDGVKIDSGK